MKSITNHSRIWRGVSIAAVFAALIVISTLQYRWAVNSGEKQINDLTKSFSFRIMGSIAQETSYISMISPGRDDSGRHQTLDERLDNLEASYQLFNSEYGSRYIRTYSYMVLQPAQEFYTFDGETWTRQDSIPAEIRNLFGREADHEDMPAMRERFRIVKPFKESESFLLVEFDNADFFMEQIMPAIAEALEGYEIAVIGNREGAMMRIDMDQYRFSPLGTLVSYVRGEQRSYGLPISFGSIPLFRMARDWNFRPSPYPENPSGYLEIKTGSGQSVYFETELSIALQWLASLLLLAGIGAAYLLILYQITRLNMLRMKEREFVASITHELRTPLTVIHSAADNIQSGILSSERIAQYGDLIKDQSSRLSSMIEGILLFSRLEGKNEEPPHGRPVKFSDLEEEISIFSRSLSERPERKVTIDFAALPVSAITHRETLELVLTNLISNASRHAYSRDSSGGAIRVKGHLRLPDTLVFTVEDDGPGIDKKERKYLFQPFFRGERSRREQIKGSGLGLYLVRRKVQLAEGTINLESPYERTNGKVLPGCRFTICLPYGETEGAGE